MSNKADQSSRLLIDESPLQVLPTLACLLGLQRALLLQQLHYLLKQPKSGCVVDGQKWIFNSYQEWTEYFPFWHWTTIRLHCQWLEQKGFLIAQQLEKASGDCRKFYRINYELLNKSVAAMQTPRTAQCSTPGIENYFTPQTVECSTIDVSTVPPLEQSTVRPYKEHETSLHETTHETSSGAREQTEIVVIPSANSVLNHEQIANAIQAGVGLQIVTPESWEDRVISNAASSFAALTPPVTLAEVTQFFDEQESIPALGWVASEFQRWRAQRKRKPVGKAVQRYEPCPVCNGAGGRLVNGKAQDCQACSATGVRDAVRA